MLTRVLFLSLDTDMRDVDSDTFFGSILGNHTEVATISDGAELLCLYRDATDCEIWFVIDSGYAGHWAIVPQSEVAGLI
jgi:hypothetical protein